jgi:hypothetical protein
MGQLRKAWPLWVSVIGSAIVETVIFTALLYSASIYLQQIRLQREEANKFVNQWRLLLLIDSDVRPHSG